ncbi:hypothetical protein LCGC14_2485700 [marine sediment metagenome]|uniref:Uncharacterized protein n=1 Tax=marine sediment metagenome TaxID=412755 RepID=A0A0F9B710_9ZZZZ
MRPPCLRNLCNSQIIDRAETFSEASNEKGYAGSCFLPGVAGTDIKGRVDCECEEAVRFRGAHGTSKPFDFRCRTQAAGPAFTRQYKQHAGRVGCRVRK